MDHLLTEARNPSSAGLDALSALEIVRLMNAEDATVPAAIATQAEPIALAIDVIADRLRAGLKLFRERCGAPTALVAAGGVAANQAIRKVLHRLAFEVGTVLVVPPPELCTDNGAMIAWAGAERLALGLTDTLDSPPHARWPLSDLTARKPAAAGAPHPPAASRTAP